jgi:hypothetical protein
MAAGARSPVLRPAGYRRHRNVNKAIKIFTCNEAAATFHCATSLLLQAEKVAVKGNGKHAGLQVVKGLALKHHSRLGRH